MTPARATVAALHRYPVKSLLGEQLDSADVTATGLAGDRALALLDTATGRVAGAKHPRLWQRLLTLTAGTDARGVRITGPDVDVHSTDPAAAKTLSALLPRDPDALRVLTRHHRVVPLPALGPQPCAGVYAQILRPGRIRPGDPVHLA